MSKPKYPRIIPEAELTETLKAEPCPCEPCEECKEEEMSNHSLDVNEL